MKQREADEEKEKCWSSENRMLINKAMKKVKLKKDKKEKAKFERQEAEILDVAEWKIVGQYMDHTGPMFEVDMAGVPKEEGDDEQYATRKDLVKDQVWGLSLTTIYATTTATFHHGRSYFWEHTKRKWH